MTDISALAAAVASQLGGTIRPAGDDADDAPSGRDIAWIDLHGSREGLRVVLRVGYGVERTRVRATMTQTMASRAGADYRETPNLHELTTAAAISRGADVIARQIESKIIAPAVPMLEAWKVKRAKLADEQASLTETVMRWRKRFPTAQIGRRDERDTEARFHISRVGANGFVSGRLSAGGRLYVDRMSTVGEATAFALIDAVLSETIS